MTEASEITYWEKRQVKNYSGEHDFNGAQWFLVEEYCDCEILKWIITLENQSGANLVYKTCSIKIEDRLCGLVVRVSGYRSRGPGFDSRPYQSFWEVGGLERDPLTLVRTIEELLEWKSSGSSLENRD
jgi:hypothetical protein